eukprot:1386858-Prymnesium_polylepis.1
MPRAVTSYSDEHASRPAVTGSPPDPRIARCACQRLGDVRAARRRRRNRHTRMGCGASVPEDQAAEPTPVPAKPPPPPAGAPVRYNTLRESPAGAKFKLCIVQFK